MDQKTFYDTLDNLVKKSEPTEEALQGLFNILFGDIDDKKDTGKAKENNEPEKTEQEEEVDERVVHNKQLHKDLQLTPAQVVYASGLSFPEVIEAMEDDGNPANVFGREDWFSPDEKGNICSWGAICGIEYPELSLREVDKKLMATDRVYTPCADDIFAKDWFAIVRKCKPL